MRALRHLFDFGSAKRHFPASTLDAVQHAIAASEHRHLGEIVFAVEGSLSFARVMRDVDPRDRAHEVFAQLRVWNTENNTGVLVYILLADHRIEVVADRGIVAKVAQQTWVDICALMQRRFSDGAYQQGALDGVAAIGDLLALHFPANGARNDEELPDRPVIL
ncbi:MAG: TPM domain-containing protein [Dokdonella sp.]|uniref:TPM domain-containing protein n=1 Tax=Dokdonella sp. TaxID=2291710 RepID=UPI00326703FA